MKKILSVPRRNKASILSAFIMITKSLEFSILLQILLKKIDTQVIITLFSY